MDVLAIRQAIWPVAALAFSVILDMVEVPDEIETRMIYLPLNYLLITQSIQTFILHLKILLTCLKIATWQGKYVFTHSPFHLLVCSTFSIYSRSCFHLENTFSVTFPFLSDLFFHNYWV